MRSLVDAYLARSMFVVDAYLSRGMFAACLSNQKSQVPKLTIQVGFPCKKERIFNPSDFMHFVTELCQEMRGIEFHMSIGRLFLFIQLSNL